MCLFKRFYILFFAVFLITNASVQSQSVILSSEVFTSKILNGQAKYSIYFPPEYSKEKTFPTLYLLHGIDGDETSWVKRSGIQKIADSLIAEKILPPIIIILPDGKNSYYINDYKGEFPFEDYFINEFIPFIDSNYYTNSNKNIRAICGLSMGGFGSTILPIKYPNVFGTSIILSGALRTPEQFISLSPIKYHSYFAPLFGDSLKGNDRITEHWKNNSPYYIIDSVYVKKLLSINWYIDCGFQDFLFPANEALHELFKKHGLLHEYHTRPGKHSWIYWRKSFIQALTYWGEILNEQIE